MKHEIKFFSEKQIYTELSGKGNLPFENDIYVKMIENIVDTSWQNDTSPISICLNSSWGTGKTTILKNCYLNNEEVHVYIYDAWKYENHSFYRDFLQQLALEIHKEKDDYFDKISEKLYDATSEYNLAAKKATVINFPLLFIIIIVLALVSLLFGFMTLFTLITSTGVASFVSYCIFKKYIKITGKIVTKSKAFSEEQFFETFNEIVDNSRYKNVIIVFDNIDRLLTCHEQINKIKVIRHVIDYNNRSKTKISFIFPLDIDKLIIQENSSSEEKYEIINKLFDTIIDIKKYQNFELKDYAKSVVEIISPEFYLVVEENNDFFNIISHTLLADQRNICKFLINLIVEVNLYDKLGIDIDKHISSFAVYLLLKQKKNEIYSVNVERMKRNKILDFSMNQGGEKTLSIADKNFNIYCESFLKNSSDLFELFYNATYITSDIIGKILLGENTNFEESYRTEIQGKLERAVENRDHNSDFLLFKGLIENGFNSMISSVKYEINFFEDAEIDYLLTITDNEIMKHISEGLLKILKTCNIENLIFITRNFHKIILHTNLNIQFIIDRINSENIESLDENNILEVLCLFPKNKFSKESINLFLSITSQQPNSLTFLNHYYDVIENIEEETGKALEKYILNSENIPGAIHLYTENNSVAYVNSSTLINNFMYGNKYILTNNNVKKTKNQPSSTGALVYFRYQETYFKDEFNLNMQLFNLLQYSDVLFNIYVINHAIVNEIEIIDAFQEFYIENIEIISLMNIDIFEKLTKFWDKEYNIEMLEQTYIIDNDKMRCLHENVGTKNYRQYSSEIDKILYRNDYFEDLSYSLLCSHTEIESYLNLNNENFEEKLFYEFNTNSETFNYTPSKLFTEKYLLSHSFNSIEKTDRILYLDFHEVDDNDIISIINTLEDSNIIEKIILEKYSSYKIKNRNIINLLIVKNISEEFILNKCNKTIARALLKSKLYLSSEKWSTMAI